MTTVKILVNAYRISVPYLIACADEHLGRPVGSVKGPSIEFAFDTAGNADTFRKVLETTFKPRPIKPSKPAPESGEDEQPTGASI